MVPIETTREHTERIAGFSMAKKAAIKMLQTSSTVWTERIERLKEWETERLELQQRKQEAQRTRWKATLRE